ncbi:hypothetical protein DPMN_095652 [Dreissena polymorpha]|uniref:Uncharacterized protein n=1 Tax=Dreissena polymorpha TaxID=45954 RepID=A0A9D4L6W8_DREPO|nr:hypothetical protein DPMN_095652 [Dreissena polymorpha]
MFLKLFSNLAKILTRELTRKNGQPPGSNVFKWMGTIFELVKYWTKNVTSRLLTRNNAAPPWGLIIPETLTRFYYSHIRKKCPATVLTRNKRAKMALCLQTKCGRTNNGQRPILKPHLSNQCSITRKTSPPPWQPCLLTHRNHLQTHLRYINSRIKETNVLTKLHENWAKNVISRVEKCPAAAMFFHRSGPFSNSSDISIKPMILINFHDDWAKIVTSRVFTRKTAPPTGGHVCQQTGTTFELNQHIIKTDILTKLHENWALNVTSTVFELDRDIIGTNILTKFHEDRTINVASRVFKNKSKNAPPPGSHVFHHTFQEDWTINGTSKVLTRKNAPPTGSNVFQPTGNIFELVQNIIGTNLLTKFLEDRTINVASSVLTRQMLAMQDR